MANQLTLGVGINAAALQAAINNVVNRTYNIAGIQVNNRGIAQAQQALGRITGSASEFQKSMEAANARVVAFGASAGVIYVLKRAFDGLISSTIEVENSITEINSILNLSSRQISTFSSQLFSAANSVSVSFGDASKAATEFARQGLGVEQTLKRTRDSLILAKISGMDFADSATAITAALNSFSNELITSADLVDRLTNADANFAVSSRDLAEAIKRVGSSASEANISLNETIALVTAAQQTTARGGSVIGNSFKTIFTRLSRGSVLDDLEAIGVKTRDASGNTLPLIQVLKNLSSTYDTLSSRQQSFVAEMVGGVYQINILKATLRDLGSGASIFSQALSTLENSTGSAQARINQLNETISAKLIVTLNNLKEISSAIGSQTFAPVFKGGLDVLNTQLETFKEFSGEGIGKRLADGILGGIKGALAGPGAFFAGFFATKLLGNFGRFVTDSVSSFAGLNSAAQQQAQIQNQIVQYLQRNPTLLGRIHSGALTVAQAHQHILDTIRQENALLAYQTQQAGIIARMAYRSGVRVTPAPAPGPARGYIPNFSSGFIPNFSPETRLARSLGASAGVKEVPGKGEIGGSGFVANSQETQIPNFAGSGETAVIPHYGGGREKAAKMIAAGKSGPILAGGFIPNFYKDEVSDIRVLRAFLKIQKQIVKKGTYRGNLDESGKLPVYRGVTPWKSNMTNEDHFSDPIYARMGPTGYRSGPLTQELHKKQLSSIVFDHQDAQHIYSNAVSTSINKGIAREFGTSVGEKRLNPLRILGNEKEYEKLYRAFGEARVKSVIFRNTKALGGRGLGLNVNEILPDSNFTHEDEIAILSKGFIPNFALKLLDKDYLAQVHGGAAGMGGENKTKIDEVFNEIVNKAAAARKIKEIVVGAPGVGKTTLAMSKGAKPIASAAEFDPGKDELIAVRSILSASSFEKDETKALFGSAEKITMLRVSQEVVDKMREKRDSQIRSGTSKTGFGRKAGSTSDAPADSSVMEAILTERYADKLKAFRRNEDFSLTEVSDRKTIKDIGSVAALVGNFGPFTKGHEKLLAAASSNPIIYASGGEINRDYGLGFSAAEKIKLIEKQYPDIPVLPLDYGTGMGEMFNYKGQVYRYKQEESEVVLGADRAEDPKYTGKFTSKGFKINAIPRSSEDISATLARKAVVENDLGTLAKYLPDKIFEAVSSPSNMTILQKRAALIQQRKDKAAPLMQLAQENLDKFVAIHGNRKKPKEDPSITETRNALKAKLAHYEKKVAGKFKGGVFGRMGLKLNLANGFIPNFAPMQLTQFKPTASERELQGGKVPFAAEEISSVRQFLKRLREKYPQMSGIRALMTGGRSQEKRIERGSNFTGIDSVVSGMLNGKKFAFMIQTKAGKPKNVKEKDLKFEQGLSDLQKSNPEFLKDVHEFVNILSLSSRNKPEGFQKKLLEFGAGLVPKLSFRKTYDKEFDITRLSGFLKTGDKKSHVGDIEFSGKETREIEAFDINKEFQGKGFAKQFYAAMGKGKTKGTLLPNYDKNGNVFFPQLSRARASKNSIVHQYDAMENVKQIKVNEFEALIAKHKGDKKYWENNSFDLISTLAKGFIPNFAESTIKNLLQYTRVTKSLAELKKNGYSNKIQLDDKLSIPEIEIEKFDPATPKYNAAVEKRKKILSQLSEANANLGKVFENEIQNKYPYLKPTSSGNEIKFSNSSALDFISNGSELIEGKAGNYSKKAVEEKFLRFPFENYDNPQYNRFLQDFTPTIDKVSLYRDKILKLITAPKSIDKPSLYREPDAAKYEENLKLFNAAKGFIPNFAYKKGGGRNFWLMSMGIDPNSVNAALKREMSAGYSSSEVQVGFDERLDNKVGVYNKNEGSLSNAINMHLASGKSMSELQTQGKSRGFIPNFAAETDTDTGITAIANVVLGSIAALRQNTESLRNQTRAQNASNQISRVTGRQAQITGRNILNAGSLSDLDSIIRDLENLRRAGPSAGSRSIGGGTIGSAQAAQLLPAAQQQREVLKAQRRQNYSMVAMGVGPAFSGIAGAMDPGQGKAAMENFGNSANLAAAAFSALPGKLGIIASGIALAGGAITSFIIANYGSSQALKLQAERMKENVANLSAASQSFLKLREVQDSFIGNSSAKATALLTAQQEYSDSLNKLPDAMRSEFKSAMLLANTKEEQAALLAKLNLKYKNQLSLREDVASRAEKGESGSNILRNILSGNFSNLFQQNSSGFFYTTAAEKERTKLGLEGSAATTLNLVDQEKLFKALNENPNMGAANVKDTLKALATNEEDKQVIENLFANLDDQGKQWLANSFLKRARQDKTQKDIESQTKNQRDELARLKNAESLRVQMLREEASSLYQAAAAISTMGARLDALRKQAAVEAESQAFGSMAGAQKRTTGLQTAARIDAEVSRRQGAAKAVSEFETKNASFISESLSKLREAPGQAAKDLTKQSPDQIAANDAIQKAMSQVDQSLMATDPKKYIDQLKAKASEGKSDIVKKEISSKLENSGIRGELEKSAQELRNNLKINEKNAEEQKKANLFLARIEQNSKAFGGIENFLDKSKAREDSREFRKSLRMAGSGSFDRAGRGGLKLIMAAQKDLGGALNEGQAGGLQEMAINARAAQIRREASKRIRQIQGSNLGFGQKQGLISAYQDVRGRSREIAKQQVEEAAKLEKAPLEQLKKLDELSQQFQNLTNVLTTSGAVIAEIKDPKFDPSNRAKDLTQAAQVKENQSNQKNPELEAKIKALEAEIARITKAAEQKNPKDPKQEADFNMTRIALATGGLIGAAILAYFTKGRIAGALSTAGAGAAGAAAVSGAGFIPNFSPLARAKRAEGANAVLDYDSGIGPFVRKSYQPSNLKTLIAKDHPEGLAAAISNSAMLQGVTGGGFIPNFITTVLTGSIFKEAAFGGKPIPKSDDIKALNDLLAEYINGGGKNRNEIKQIIGLAGLDRSNFDAVERAASNALNEHKVRLDNAEKFGVKVVEKKVVEQTAKKSPLQLVRSQPSEFAKKISEDQAASRLRLEKVVSPSKPPPTLNIRAPHKLGKPPVAHSLPPIPNKLPSQAVSLQSVKNATHAENLAQLTQSQRMNAALSKPQPFSAIRAAFSAGRAGIIPKPAQLPNMNLGQKAFNKFGQFSQFSGNLLGKGISAAGRGASAVGDVILKGAGLAGKGLNFVKGGWNKADKFVQSSSTKIGNIAKFVGKTGFESLKGHGKLALRALGPLIIAHDILTSNDDLQTAGSKAFVSTAGMLIGGAIGTFFGGPIGSYIGSTLGAMAGNWINDKLFGTSDEEGEANIARMEERLAAGKLARKEREENEFNRANELRKNPAVIRGARFIEYQSIQDDYNAKLKELNAKGYHPQSQSRKKEMAELQREKMLRFQDLNANDKARFENSKLPDSEYRTQYFENRKVNKDLGVEQPTESYNQVIQNNSKKAEEIRNKTGITYEQRQQELLDLEKDKAEKLRGSVIDPNLFLGVGRGRAEALNSNSARGFIPNFSPAREAFSALAHGYTPGKIFSRRIYDGKGGSFNSFVNSAESIRDFRNSSGNMATLVTPPNGFGPNTTIASAAGFIPNFQKLKDGLASGGESTSLAASIESLSQAIAALQASIDQVKNDQAQQTAVQPAAQAVTPEGASGGTFTLNIVGPDGQGGSITISPDIEKIKQDLDALTSKVITLETEVTTAPKVYKA